MDKNLLVIVGKHLPRTRPAGFGITASELAVEKKCSVHYARKVLNNLVDSGILQFEEMLDGKKTGGVYFEAKKK